MRKKTYRNKECAPRRAAQSNGANIARKTTTPYYRVIAAQGSQPALDRRRVVVNVRHGQRVLALEAGESADALQRVQVFDDAGKVCCAEGGVLVVLETGWDEVEAW